MSIKAVLFDYGGVLAEEGFRNGLLDMAREQALDIESMPNDAMQAVYDSGFVLGKGTVTAFWALMRKRTGLDGEDAVLTKRILDGFVLRPWIIKLIQQLRDQGYVTGILSDQTHWLDWLNERDHFYDVFDHIFNSYTMGKGKRNPGLFNDIAVKLALSTDEILFVDDSEDNVARAKEAGWQSILYVDKVSFIKELQIKGV
jgi:putative hydrolase of the HAD superfamily